MGSESRPSPSVSGNIQTHWGILGTPVIHGSTIYLVAYIGQTTDQWSLYLCALDIRTGTDQFGPPSEILFPFQGNLVSATPNTIQRAALLVANETLYVGLANFQTRPPERESQEGFLFAYSLTDMTQPFARFQVTDGQGGDIWQAGRGLAADESGNVYVNTGNGFYDGITNYGDSVLKFGSDLTLVDWFTPHNWAILYQNNLALSASGPILIPGTNKLVAGGKEGVLYLLNESDMGKLRNHRGSLLQRFHATHGCFQTDCSQTLSMAYWDRQSDSLLYVWDRRDRLRVFGFDGSLLRTRPVRLGKLVSEAIGGVSISANGSQSGTGIVWAITASEDPAFDIVPGTVRAYDATDVRHELWNSEMIPERDSMGNFTKFSSPLIANGKVYVITQSNQLVVYGLLHQ